MDGDLSDGLIDQRANSLGWKNRLNYGNISPSKTTSNQQPARPRQLNIEDGGAIMERKPGESRRTSKRQQDVNGGGEAPTTNDLTAVMDNYFFFNAAHAAATSGKAIGGKINGDKNILNVGNNDAHTKNPYPDSEELESRFVRTLEWVGEASRALSPSSSSLSREAAISRSLLRAPNNTTNNDDDDDENPSNTELTNEVREILSNSNNNNNNHPNTELTTEVREIMSNSNEITETNAPRSINADINEPRRTRNIMNASVSRDIYTGSSSFRVPLPSAISRGEVHAPSFRAPKSSSNVHSKVSANPNVDPSFRPSNGVPNMNYTLEGPSATCKLPCQSCGDRPAKRGDKDGINSSANHNYNLNHNHNHNGGESLHSKPGYGMGHYDRNDRLAKSAYHKTQRKVHPNDENFVGAEKFTSKKGQKVVQVGAASSAREAAGEAAKASTAAKVQLWLSKLVGKSDQPKTSKRPKPPAHANANAKKLQPPTNLSANPAANRLAYGTTMHDVLTHKANLIPNPAPNPALDDIKPPLPRIDLHHPSSAPPFNPKPRRPITRSAGAVNPAPISANPTAPISANPAPISNNHEEERGSSRRILDDAHLQRFGYGSKSEKWAPLHLNQQQQWQARQRLVAPLPTNYNTKHGKPARLSPACKAQQQVKLPLKLVDAEMCDNDRIIDESSSPVKRQQQIMDEDDERNPPRFTPHFQSKSQQLVQPSKANASRLAAEDAQYGRVISANLATKQERGDNPSAFIANYASQSERFSSRRIRNEARRSFSKPARAAPNELKGAIMGEEGLISANDDIKSSDPAPAELPQDRDIAVLNNFLIQKKENLQHCSDRSRLHLILSNSSLSSMISALCYSWILHNSKTRKMDGWEHVPVMNIPRNSMWNHKPLAWLFQQAEMDTQALLFIDEVNQKDIVGSVGEYRISTIGHQDIVRARGELAGLLMDTENLGFTNVFCTRRDEIAATSLLPGAGHDGREVLLAELKQNHETQDFYNMMCQSYGNQHTIELGSFEDMHNYQRHKAMDVTKIFRDGTRSKHGKYNSSSFSSSDNTDFFSEDASSLARTKSSKSYTSISTTSTTDLGKSRLSPTSSPPIDRTYISGASMLCGGERNTNL